MVIVLYGGTLWVGEWRRAVHMAWICLCACVLIIKWEEFMGLLYGMDRWQCKWWILSHFHFLYVLISNMQNSSFHRGETNSGGKAMRYDFFWYLGLLTQLLSHICIVTKRIFGWKPRNRLVHVQAHRVRNEQGNKIDFHKGNSVHFYTAWKRAHGLTLVVLGVLPWWAWKKTTIDLSFHDDFVCFRKVTNNR